MFPKLVRGAKIPVHVVITSEDVNEFGERTTVTDSDFLCNYQDSAGVKYSKDRQSPSVTGAVYIDGDIAPDVAAISCGHVTIFGKNRDISKGYKARNFDGSVNYTRLDVI